SQLVPGDRRISIRGLGIKRLYRSGGGSVECIFRMKKKTCFKSCMVVPAVAGILLLLSACDRRTASATTQPGADIQKGPPRRIISIAPNATEIIGELGCADRLVAVSTFCNYPPQVRNLPKV